MECNARTKRTALIVAMVALGAWSLSACTSEPGRSGTDGGITPGRDGSVTPRPDGSRPPPLDGAPAGTLCSDECGMDNAWVGDGACDDGGEGSMFSVCDFGADCTDCGPRNPADCVPSCAEGAECGDDGCGGSCGSCTGGAMCMGSSCVACGCEGIGCGMDPCGTMDCGSCTAPSACYRSQCRTPMCEGRDCGSDGAGGRCGAMMGSCAEGQFCSTGHCTACGCGTRQCGSVCGETCGPMMGSCAEGQTCDRLSGECLTTPNPSCNNTCITAGDGECDDGRPGSLYSICELGSDCEDCGPTG